MALPDDLAMGFWEEIEQFEEEQAMPYVTSVERIGIQKGIYDGVRSLLKRQIELKFGEVPADIAIRVDEAGQDQLFQWSERILTADNLSDIFGN